MEARRLTRERCGTGAIGALLYALDYPMESLADPIGRFDFAISLGSMEHALNIPAAVREMARILKPGGRYLLYVPNEEWVHEDQPLETTATGDEWVELLIGAGLGVDSVGKIRDNNRIVGRKP